MLLPGKAIVSSFQFRLYSYNFLNHWEFNLLTTATTFEVCKMSDNTLAKLIGCSTSTVYRTIKSLVDKGIIIKRIKMNGFIKNRECHFNWRVVQNRLEEVILKEGKKMTRTSLHSEEIDIVTVTDNSKYSLSKYKGIDKRFSYKVKAANKITTEKSLVNIVAAVGGRLPISGLSNAEKDLINGLGGTRALSCNRTELMRLCGKSGFDYHKIHNAALVAY